MIARQLADVQVWVATTPVDMRKSFDSLAEVVRSQLGHDPLSGNLFMFRNRGGHLIKILWWDDGGLTIYYRRLERGVFPFPAGNAKSMTITAAQLLRLLSGLEIVVKRSA